MFVMKVIIFMNVAKTFAQKIKNPVNFIKGLKIF